MRTREQINELHLHICTLRVQGLLLRIIAERVGLSLKMVQRVLTRHQVYRRGKS
jgi:hypothetical protein